MKLFILALGIALFLEGFLIGIKPDFWRKTVYELAKMPDKKLSQIGLTISAGALILISIAIFMG